MGPGAAHVVATDAIRESPRRTGTIRPYGSRIAAAYLALTRRGRWADGVVGGRRGAISPRKHGLFPCASALVACPWRPRLAGKHRPTTAMQHTCGMTAVGRTDTFKRRRKRRQWPLQALKKNVRTRNRFRLYNGCRPGRQCVPSRRRRAAHSLVCCSTLATSGRNDAPYASPFAERSAPNAVLPLKDGGPLRV